MPKGKKAALKKTVKFLSVCQNPRVFSHIIAKAPDNLVKSICNAAINAAQGEVVLKKKAKRVLSSNRQFIQKLIKKGDSIKRKKKILCQSGGSISATVLPPLLRSVLASIGTGFI
ncbi:MAG: hypothetical protein FD188_3521 [Ignavibacteria bacterium]|nr:MAG: hypothetical protein FD188_3521 [Ignavibacteria bacterium]